MYSNILVALDNSPTDQAMVPYITELVRVHGSELLLLHGADGWAARNYNRFQLADSEEMKEDQALPCTRNWSWAIRPLESSKPPRLRGATS